MKVFTDPATSDSRGFTDRRAASLPVTANKLETIRDSSRDQALLNGDTGGLKSAPCVKDHKQSEKQADPVEPSNPHRAMLSSSVVMVLAPHWSGKLRRNKRFEGTSNPEAQGTLQDVTNSVSNRERVQFQGTADQSLIHRSYGPMRTSFAGARKNTDGWSTKSGPASLDYGCKRRMMHTVSLDGNSEGLDNRKVAAFSSVASSSPPSSPVSLDQRLNTQILNQGGLSLLSSKPTTSGLLLSLRRFNSNSRISTAPLSETKQAVQSHLSQSHHDNNKDRSNPLLSPSSISPRMGSSPVLSPLSKNHREKTVSDTHCFHTSASPLDKEIQDTRQPQKITRAQSSLLSSNRPVQNRGLSERQLNFRGSDTTLFSESSSSTLSHCNDRSAFLLPRKTTLTSTSWWKQVNQEGSSPSKLSHTISLKDKLHTPSGPPSNNNKSDLAPDFKGPNSQITNNRDHNNTTVLVLKGSHGAVRKPRGGSHNLTEGTSEDSSQHDSDKLDKQLSESRFNIREPQQHQSLPDVFSRSKISRAKAQKTLSHPEDCRVLDGSDKSLNPKIIGLRPTLQNQHQNNQCAFKTNSSSSSPHSKDSQSLSPPHLSVTPQTTSSLYPPSSKTDPSLKSQSHILSPSSAQTYKFTVGFSPLGFERSYDSAAKSFQPKASLLPTFKAFSKTHSTPVSTASFTTAKLPAATVALSSSLPTPPNIPALSSPSTPTCSSSLLTPPATPVLTSPDSAFSSPQERRDFSSSQERDSKKHSSEGKRVRRVTWEDSVDFQQSEPIIVHSKEASQVPTSSLSSPRSSRNTRTPSIFSFLRSSSPTTNMYPLCTPTTGASSLQAEKGGKYRSFSAGSASAGQDKSKLRPSDPLILDQKVQTAPSTSQGRTLSESGLAQSHSSAALSLPSDFLSDYRLRYSSPPYSTLMSARSTQGETKPTTPRSQLFQHSLIYIPHPSKNVDPDSAMTSSTAISPLQPHAQPSLSKASTQEGPNSRAPGTSHVNNNDSKTNSQDSQDRHILLVNNKEHISSHSQQEAEVQGSAQTCVIETLVYSITPKGQPAASKINTCKTLHDDTANTAVALERRFSQPSHKVLNKDTAEEAGSHFRQSSSETSSTDSHSTDDDSRKMKDSVHRKSRFLSVESNNEQSPKRSRFALKKNNSTSNSSLARSESDRAIKTNNKMDQVLSRLRQTFSTRRSDEELSFPWRWRRSSQTSSSDTSNVSEVPQTKRSVQPEQEKKELPRDNVKETEDTNKWTHDTCSLISTQTPGGSETVEKPPAWSESSPQDHHSNTQSSCAEKMSENKIKTHLTIQSPTTHPFNLYNDSANYQPTKQLLSSQDVSPGQSSNLSAGCPPLLRATPSPRSPFSPFSSLSPLSPFPSADVSDDNVFYSPKLQRRRESPSPCEGKPGENISLRGSRKSRASTGPPMSAGQDKTCSASSYADLKYGIEPGRSISVSSVLSSRPSGPGRISTGSRFMSVGDLSESALTCEETRKGFNQRSISPDSPNREFDFPPGKDSLMSYFSSDPSKMKTRSLPRSLTRRLANWSSGGSVSEASVSKPAHLWRPNMNTFHFAWETEGPPTPPPTPPMSPVSRRMSNPPSLTSPSCSPSSPGSQQMDSPSSRGHLPSRAYISSLHTFEESSDNSSDTTTDDEYYLETGEDQKETEL